MGETCARPLYFALRAAQVDGEVRWLVLFLRVARPADGELFQLVVVDDAALVRLVLVVENGPTGTPRPSVANWLDVAHLLESGDLSLSPVWQTSNCLGLCRVSPTLLVVNCFGLLLIWTVPRERHVPRLRSARALEAHNLLSPHPARVVVPRTVWTSTARRPPKSKQVALPVCKHELLRPKVLKFIDVVRQ